MSLVAIRIVAVLLFCTGISGFLLRRNAVVLLLSLQSMFAAIILLVASFADGESAATAEAVIAFLVLLVSCQAAVGLGLAVAVFRARHRLDVDPDEELES